MADRYGWHLYPGAVREQTDLIQAVQLFLRLTTSPGDSVVIQTLNYPTFLATLNAMGLQPLAFPFIDSDEGWVPDFVEFERSLRVVRPKVLILVNPHNPTGRVHTRTELLRNVELAAEFNLDRDQRRDPRRADLCPSPAYPFRLAEPRRCIAHHDDHLRR